MAAVVVVALEKKPRVRRLQYQSQFSFVAAHPVTVVVAETTAELVVVLGLVPVPPDLQHFQFHLGPELVLDPGLESVLLTTFGRPLSQQLALPRPMMEDNFKGRENSKYVI